MKCLITIGLTAALCRNMRVTASMCVCVQTFSKNLRASSKL